MHRNTVNYRIQQIENLFSVDFSDPSLLFKLQYSFYIDAFLKNRYSDLAPLPEKPEDELLLRRGRGSFAAPAPVFFCRNTEKSTSRAGGAPVLYADAALLSRRSPRAP